MGEYLVKGFTLDDERLKNPPGPDTPDYFDELLERIRDIRSSEQRMYLRVRDILALAADYDPSAAETQRFFRRAEQAPLLGHRQDRAELIAERADHALPNMGLTTWKGDVVRKTDVAIAKNYLREGEIGELNRIVVMFLDFAEDQARRRKQVFMNDWATRLDDFLRFNDRRVLDNAGGVSRESAERQAHDEYDRFQERRRLEADRAAEERHLQEIDAAVRSLPKAPRDDKGE